MPSLHEMPLRTKEDVIAFWQQWEEEMEEGFIVKDSGNRQQFASGMMRDTEQDKIQYDLVFDGPLFERLAIHLTKGAKKYARRNWMKAGGQEELERFRSSAIRHFYQWMRGDMDEDHFAAVVFNLNGYEYLREKLQEKEGSQ